MRFESSSSVTNSHEGRGGMSREISRAASTNWMRSGRYALPNRPAATRRRACGDASRNPPGTLQGSAGDALAQEQRKNLAA